MAKTIKFNLICDDTPIRTIEDLRENFSIEDVLMYYRNGLLERWLEVRGYDKELEMVSCIKSGDSLRIVKELIKIFDVSTNEKDIEKGVYIIDFLNKQKERFERYEENKFKAYSVISDYQTEYTNLVQGILDNPNDAARIKANIKAMASNYKWALDLNHRELFWTLHDKSILSIMCLLMNEKTREYYMPKELDNLDNEKKFDIQVNEDKRNMYNAICKLPESFGFIEKLGDNIHRFAGVTEGYWKDLEPKGKKYMIISMGAGDFVRSAGALGCELSSADIKDSFVIIDGIDYKSNSTYRQLLYMEV